MLAIASAEDFHAAVAASASSGKALVACFSAPWCGGCKLVAPKVAELATQLQASADFVSVSAEELEKLCEELEVDSYPHFRVYQEGKRAGDCTSSKFDKVDAFIRGFVAPETLKKEEEETPEGNAVETEETAAEEEEATEKQAEGEEENGASKKRQERDEMEANDEHVAKKAKTEEEEVAEAPKEEGAVAEEAEKSEEEEKAEETDELEEKEQDEEEVAEEVTADDAEKVDEEEKVAAEKETPAGKNEEEVAPADKLEASEAVGAEADAAAA